jgi:hypothetical protein
MSADFVLEWHLVEVTKDRLVRNALFISSSRAYSWPRENLREGSLLVPHSLSLGGLFFQIVWRRRILAVRVFIRVHSWFESWQLRA